MSVSEIVFGGAFWFVEDKWKKRDWYIDNVCAWELRAKN